MKRIFLFPAMVLLCPLPALAIFYGDDDYVEVDQIEKSDAGVDWASIAQSVAIVIDDPGQGHLDLSKLPTMRQRFRKPPLDPEYKYGEQPRLAQLTAFLVDRDKVMTAGHAGARRLQRSAFLFDYTWDSKNKCLAKTRYEQSELYRCKKVLLHRNDKFGDYAVVLLDRPVPDRQPLSLRAVEEAAAVDRNAAKMISAPDGTPLKLTVEGEIRGQRPSERSPELNLKHFFFHTLDNSGGSSGAPILDAKTGHVIGIQSGGDDNFTQSEGVVVPTQGDFEESNLGRPLKGEWGSLIPLKAVELVEQK